MNRLLKSICRILITVVLTAALLLAVLFVVVRQPGFRSLPYPVGARASVSLLREHVAFLTTTVRPRGADNPEHLDRTAAYIAQAFARSGGCVSEQTFLARGRTYRNIIADFGPGTNEKLIVGAHYDAFTSTGDLPGADD